MAPAEDDTGAASARGVIGGLLRRGGWRMAVLFVAVLLPLWGFAELAEQVHRAEALVFDDPLLHRAHALAGPVLDRLALALAWLGYQGVIACDAGLCLGLLLRRRWRAGVFAAIATAGGGLLNVGAKLYFARDRPTLWRSISPQDTFSFPSGHAMGSAVLALVLVLLAWRTRWRWPVLLVAGVFVLAVGASRVYLGVHYPSDVLGGWLAALAWVLGVHAALYGHRHWGRPPA